jgi:hypothetical protein
MTINELIDLFDGLAILLDPAVVVHSGMRGGDRIRHVSDPGRWVESKTGEKQIERRDDVIARMLG